MQISVVVPALNEESVLERCLTSLQLQTLPAGSFEVIVVDNGSTDRTRDIARQFAAFLPVTVLEQSNVRISALRNLGATAAQGEFLAFLDADCEAPRHWLQQICDLLHADPFRIVGAQYRIPPGSSWVARAWYGDLWRMKAGPVAYVPGGDLAIARELFLNLGGFDVSIVTSEDTEFCERASASSLPVLAIPALSVVHLGTPQSLRGFYKKQSWHGVNVHRVFLRDVLHSNSRKAMLFAVYMLAAMLLAVAGLFASALSASAAPLLAGIAVVLLGPSALTLQASLERKRWKNLLPLVVLYTAYGIARAMCLLGIGGARQPRTASNLGPAAQTIS